MSRQKIAAGNWKMNKDFEEGMTLINAILSGMPAEGAKVILATPFIHLQAAAQLIGSSEWVSLAAQNCHQEEQGAYTGEVSVSMLKSVGVEYVLVGHSERRQYFDEDDALLARKVQLILAHGMKPIFCCGESLAVREEGDHITFVASQLRNSLFDLGENAMRQCIIAYEPIWAIGTGVTASPQQAQEMHSEIRRMIGNQYGRSLAEMMPILYGGSVKPSNAQELFSQSDVDGGLVGGASLKADDFIEIINACRQ